MSRRQQVESDAQQSESTEREVAPPWGEWLHETRIRRGLSIDEVSNALLLEAPLIEAIEAEDCERLPGSSFVKGYLRNYAKLLELDPEPLVAAYRQVCGNEEPALTQVTKIKDISSRDAAPRYTRWIVIVVLAVSFAVWWWSEMLTSVDAPAPSFGPEIDALRQPDMPLAPQPPAAPATEAEPPPPELPADGGQGAIEVQAAPPESTLDTLRLSFTEDSWVEIEDARGERLFMDLARAGQTKTLEGEAPFEILLGNAPAVTVEYNGEVYEHAEHNRKGVARFTLGE